MPSKFHLVSSVTCPWVQRAVIMLRAKGVEFDVTYINLKDKPDWFLEISPHGRVPVLKVDDVALFESNAIAEYLDEVFEPRLHPEDPIRRAQNRAWTDFLPTFAWGPGISNLSYCASREELPKAIETVRDHLSRLEGAIEKQRGDDGPYFNGDRISLVDAAYGPFFMRFAICDKALQTGLLDEFPLVKAWSDALLADDAVIGSVPPEFPQAFEKNIENRGALAWQIMQGAEVAE
jgi:glutathione S-transferase